MALNFNDPSLDPFRPEWNRVQSMGDRRSFDQWLFDHLAATRNPEEVEVVAQLLSQGVLGPEDDRWADLVTRVIPDYAVDEGTQELPFEQALGQQVIDDYVVRDLDGDVQRRTEADEILARYQPNLDASRQTIADLSTVGPDGVTTLGQSEIDANARTVAEQLAALDAELASLEVNLDADTTARAESLRDQLALLSSGLTTYTEAERAALTQQLSENFTALETEVAAKRSAIETELSTMGQAITEQDAARQAALQTELAKLAAAQEPLKALRIRGAEALTTSVNLGVQVQQDQIRAQMAQQGYIGGSSATDAALMRASIDGRQRAALAMTDAQLANAFDDAELGRYGATGERSIADSTAGLRFDTGVYGAGQNRGLTDYGAGGTRQISDFGSAQQRAIASTDATSRLSLNQYGAGEGRTAADYATTERRNIRDTGANERRGITDAGAARKFSLFSGDIQRRLAALSAPAAAVQTEFGLRKAADDYAQSGLDRTFRNLSFFNLGGGQAPNAQTHQVAPNDTTGTAFQNVGAGLVSAAGSVGNASNWWQPTKKAATTQPLALNWTGSKVGAIA